MGKTLSSSVLIYDTKPTDGKIPIMELLGMWSIFSLPLLPSPLWLDVVAPFRVSSIGKTELLTI